jgi:hypothetical protein
MTPMILTEEQERLIAQVAEPVEVHDARGRFRGVFSPVSSADADAIAQVQKARAAGGPRIPSSQVQAHLRRLNEIRQTKPMDEARMLELLQRMQAGKEV